jgi:hypothetical protein
LWVLYFTSQRFTRLPGRRNHLAVQIDKISTDRPAAVVARPGLRESYDIGVFEIVLSNSPCLVADFVIIVSERAAQLSSRWKQLPRLGILILSFVQQSEGSSSGFVTVTARGSVTDGPNYLTVTYLGNPGQSLESLTIDASKGDLIFDTKAKNPAPAIGTTIGIAPSNISFVTGPESPLLTLHFKPGKFVSGDSVSFTIDQDNALTGVSGGQCGLSGGWNEVHCELRSNYRYSQCSLPEHYRFRLQPSRWLWFDRRSSSR